MNSSPSIADDLVYFGSGIGTVIAVDLVTGLERWTFQTEVEAEHCGRTACPDIQPAPLIADGVLYIGNDASYFYALESPE